MSTTDFFLIITADGNLTIKTRLKYSDVMFKVTILKSNTQFSPPISDTDVINWILTQS